MKDYMIFFQSFFWICLFIVFYSHMGYGILLYFIIKVKRILKGRKIVADNSFEPEVSFVIPCYNEKEIISDKIDNCRVLDYPGHKLKFVFVTDGSTDGTDQFIASKFPEATVLHEPQRRGKSAAENRSMKFIDTPIVVFSDANTVLPPDALKKLIRHYVDPKVGAVSGEKRIVKKSKDSATGAGEGIYWKYESKLKSWDSELLTIVGAAGELFSFRRELFHELEEDTILDDFMLSMRIAAKGYKVIYEPEAHAHESASENVKEELKRKIRICAGGWQSMVRLSSVLNPMKNPLLTFQYISHRVLRWSLAPLMLLLLFPLNIILFNSSLFYKILFYGQCFFYISAMLGWYLENQRIRNKLLFVPYYFFIMNYAVFAGFLRYMIGVQPAAWERAKRRRMTIS